MQADLLPPDTTHRMSQVFGSSTDPIESVEGRAEQLLEGQRAIVWEGDAATFQFSFVGKAAEALLGYPRRRWTEEPTFWADTVVHPDDRDEAIAFCALATGKGQDHDFIYRARAADARVVWLHDVVKVIRGSRGVPERLRGIMVDVTDQMTAKQ
jgi:PAS domain-containing protein